MSPALPRKANCSSCGCTCPTIRIKSSRLPGAKCSNGFRNGSTARRRKPSNLASVAASARRGSFPARRAYASTLACELFALALPRRIDQLLPVLALLQADGPAKVIFVRKLQGLPEILGLIAKRRETDEESILVLRVDEDFLDAAVETEGDFIEGFFLGVPGHDAFVALVFLVLVHHKGLGNDDFLAEAPFVDA